MPVIRNGLVSVFHRDLMARCPHFSPGRDVWSCLIRWEARQVRCRIWSCFHPKQTRQSNGTSMKVQIQIQIQIQIPSFATGISSFDTFVMDQGEGWANDDYVRRRGAGGHLLMLTNNSGGADGRLLTMSPWLSSWILTDWNVSQWLSAKRLGLRILKDSMARYQRETSNLA